MKSALRLWLVKRLLRRLKTPRDVTRFACRRYGERTAVIAPDRTQSYAELGRRVRRLASGWRHLGIRPGDPVFAQLPDSARQIEVRLAAHECGAIITLLSPVVTPDQIREAARLITPRLFVHDARFDAAAALLAQDHPALSTLRAGEDYEALVERQPDVPSEVAIDPEAMSSLGFTSGTTGTPKVLTATHAVFLTSMRMIVENVGIGVSTGPNILAVGIPLTGAGSGIVLPTLLGGGALVIPPTYDATTLLELIDEHRATRLFTTPSLLIDILDHPDLDRFDIASLRNIIYGTELMPAAKLEEALRRFGPILQQGYGSAEVLPPVSMLQAHEHMKDGKPAARQVLNSAGKVVPQVSVVIADDNDCPLSAGMVGEVLVKSPTLFKGYWRRPDLNSETLRGGFLHTGDMGYVSGDGYLHLLGRRPDLVRRQGAVIYPRLIEEVIHDHPAVKEASLVQVGEEAVMAVSLRRSFRGRETRESTAAALLEFLRRHVRPEELPDRIEILEELPRSYLAKVLRREVRAALSG